MIKSIIIENKETSYSEVVEHSTWKFPAGEIGFRINNPESLNGATEVFIKSRLNSSDSIVEFLMAVDAIRNISPNLFIYAHLPYLPYERQDRVCSPGESLSLRVFSDMIKNSGIDAISTIEPHSDKTIEFLPHLEIDSLGFILDSVKEVFNENSVFVAPDFGATQRVGSLAKKFYSDKVFYAKKVRELSTGRITHLELEGDVKDKDVIIFDDLIDGGKTFIEIAKVLKEKGANKLHLFVIHGIFSKGIELITDLYDSVTTTDSYQDFSNQDLPKNFKVLRVLDLDDIDPSLYTN